VVSSPRALPQTFRAAVVDELVGAFSSPYEVPIVVAGNGLLVVLLWLSPLSQVMFDLHGALAFPLVLGSWMYADVPATNVLGGDRRTLRVLDDEPALMRMLAAKSTVLWLFVAPGCVLLAVVIGVAEGQPLSAFWTALAIAVVPWGTLAVTDWVGVIWPYRPVTLRRRWRERRQVRTQLRWSVLVCVPYVVVPAVMVVLALPAWAWWWHETGGVIGEIPDRLGLEMTLIASVVSVLAWVGGRATTRRLVRRRRSRLETYLADPASS
jgi:hypothetical protein